MVDEEEDADGVWASEGGKGEGLASGRRTALGEGGNGGDGGTAR